MYENEEEWDKSVPADLIPAIEHLREGFDRAHFGCGWATRIYCYAALHKTTVDDPEKEFSNYLTHVKEMLGAAGVRQFNDRIREGTLPAIFKAYCDLYLDGVSHQAVHAFTQLVAIGRANEERLGLPFLEWAEAQAKHLIRSHRQEVENWVREVCDIDIDTYDPKEDDEEKIFRRKWQAPSLITMKPSGQRPYDAEKVWDRNDAQTSSTWLKFFKDHYVLHLEIKIRKLAGEAALALAKQPKPAQTSPSQQTGPTPNQGKSDAASQRPGKQSTLNLRREARKRKTQAKYASWRRAYSRLVKEHPDKTDVSYAQKICQMKIGNGSSAETIRKHMKK